MCSLLRSIHREVKVAPTTLRVKGALGDALLNSSTTTSVRSVRRFFRWSISLRNAQFVGAWWCSLKEPSMSCCMNKIQPFSTVHLRQFSSNMELY